jgi:hypothetical protein
MLLRRIVEPVRGEMRGVGAVFIGKAHPAVLTADNPSFRRKPG